MSKKIVVIALIWAVSTYNGFVRLRNLVQEAWRQIDVELKRRHDLIGNLVETVKGYAAHERGTLEDDVLVTPDGPKILSTGLPRTADEVEAWLAHQRAQGPRLP